MAKPPSSFWKIRPKLRQATNPKGSGDPQRDGGGSSGSQRKNSKTMSTEKIYKVTFHTQPLSGQEFFFGSLTAIYDRFTPEQVGCQVRRLYNLKVPSGVPYLGKHCTITRIEFQRKSRNNPSEGRRILR